MSALSNAIRTPFGIILPLSEVKGRAIVDALDKCGGNYRLAARLLGIGKSTIYRIARTYNYQSPKVQAELLMSISQCKSSFDPTRVHGEHMRTNDALNVGESTAPLHAIFPRHPDLRGMKAAPEADGFLLDLRSQSSLVHGSEIPLPAVDGRHNH
jgi:regulatory Fis family protein